jgi:signal transduction histidine kinase
MSDNQLSGDLIQIEPIHLRDVADLLPRTRVFAETPFNEIAGIDGLERITVKAGTTLVEAGEPWAWYWLVLEGETLAKRPEPDGTWTLIGIVHPGEGFGEVPLLIGRATSLFRIFATQDSVLLRFSAQDFWSMMACCPAVRKNMLADSAQRMQSYQVEALHREKLVSLGTLAAGLMHELNNPSSAARRAASQLRENLLRLQEISLRGSGKPKTPEQIECMKGLLEHALHGGCNLQAMSSLDQADAEEAMSEWLSKAGVENAYTIGPVLVSMGLDRQEIACAQEHFDATAFSDALNWFGALVSSVSLVCSIEESIARVSELVTAVKKFAYDERNPAKGLDVHDSLQSTITILGHKLRLRQIQVEKRFAASPSTIFTRGYALSQVWTNLIDNALDASPEGSKIEIATWSEPGWLVVCIGDHGSGIPSEVLPHIFEPFFTTKPEGSGTGLGLEIVYRIVTQKFGGTIDVESQPGDTRFIVRLPMKTPEAEPAANSEKQQANSGSLTTDN